MIVQRIYKTYGEYIDLQGGKARSRSAYLLAHHEKNVQRFLRIFQEAATHLHPGSVLCLGARTGAESIAAISAGFPGSIGIDLHPVGHTVILADWQDLPFPAQSFANVYCNCLDHCFSLDRLTSDVRRVLVPDGRFYVMATNRAIPLKVWLEQSPHEALYWATSDELRDALCVKGFTLRAAWRRGKWGHYIFDLTETIQ